MLTPARRHVLRGARLVLLVLFLVPGTVLAFEATLFYGLQLGGGLQDSQSGATLDLDEGGSFGVLLDWDLDPNSQVEVFLSHQETRFVEDTGLFTSDQLFDLDLNILQVGGLYQWDGRTGRPYIAAALGATFLQPEPGGLDDEIRFSASGGGGARVRLGERVALRFEGRGFATFFFTDSSIFCRNNACLVEVGGDVLWNLLLSAGVTVRF